MDQYLQPNVEHIFVTPFFQRYILEHVRFFDDREEDIKLRDTIAHGYYFFSDKSLRNYWRTHAYAERRTIQVDLAKYRAGGVSAGQISQELENHRHGPHSQKETNRHRAAMEKLLSEEGFRLFLRAGEQSDWTPYPLPELTDNLPLTTLAAYRRSKGLGSDTAASKQLMRKGCIRIKLGSRSLWVADPQNCRCPITVPVDAVVQHTDTPLVN